MYKTYAEYLNGEEKGKSWCEINVDGFKEKREKRERMRTERIKKY